MDAIDIYRLDLNRCLSEIDKDAVGRLASELRTVTGTVHVLGNGGSQSNASHLVLHLSMSGISSVDLAAHVAMLTAFSNDYAYAAAPLHSLRSTGRKSDALMVISGSGDSPNILTALAEARHIGMRTFGLLGFGGGAAHEMCDCCVCLDSKVYGPVEDCHSVIIHMIQDILRRPLDKSQNTV